MKRFTLCAALVLLAGCYDNPAEPARDFADPIHPTFSHASSATVTDLGDLGGDMGFAYDVNSHGHVVGHSTTADGNDRPFYWTPEDGMQNLGSLNADDPRVYAYQMNDNGEVVGVGYTSSGARYGFYWSASTGMIDVGSLGGGDTFARGIDELGRVVGHTRNASNTIVSFIWSRTEGIRGLNLGTTPAIARSINTAGQIGGYGASGFQGHAFRWSLTGEATDLGTLGGTVSVGWEMNEQGHVVGYSTTGTGGEHPFLWTPTGGMQDLGTLADYNNCRASSSNSYAWVVGTCRDANPSLPTGYLWIEGEGMQALPTLGGSYSLAAGINDSNASGEVQIVGYSSPAGEQTMRPTLWTLPAPSAETQVSSLSGVVENYESAGVLSEDEAAPLLSKLSQTQRMLGTSASSTPISGSMAEITTTRTAAERSSPRAATQLLKAFIHQVDAYVREGVLEPAQGQTLTRIAHRAIRQMQ